MTQIKQLEAYTEASKKLAKFKEKHSDVFEKFNELVVVAADAEAALKDVVKTKIKDDIANDDVKVKYSPTFSRSYDAKVVLSMATPKMKQAIIDEGALIQKIDNEIFEDLVTKGKVDVSIKQKAFREKEGAPRVIISENK
jgi:uncharacterized protein YdeI (BOF family)